MAVSTFGFAITGFSWIAGVSSIREFSIKMKGLMGGAEKEEVYLNAPEDPELAKLGDSINQAFNATTESK